MPDDRKDLEDALRVLHADLAEGDENVQLGRRLERAEIVALLRSKPDAIAQDYADEIEGRG